MADLDLDRELRALGRRLDVPPAPDVTFAVRARLRAPAPRRSPVLRYAVVILLLVLSAVFAVPPVRAAVVEFFRIGSVEVRSEPGPPLPSTPVRSDQLVPDLAAAERLTGIRVRPPELLGPPDEVRVLDGRVVSLAYRPTAGRPAIRLDVVGGTLEPVFRKYLEFREAVEVDLGGESGWFVPGPHELVYLDADGNVRRESARLAGPTLIWHHAGTTFRLEAALPRDRLAGIARSMLR